MKQLYIKLISIFIIFISIYYLFGSLDNLYIDGKFIEYMDNNTSTGKKCEGLDEHAIETIHKTTTEINELREDLNKLNITDIQTKINDLDYSIKNNTDDLNDIIDQQRVATNDNLGMDIQPDGTVYDEKGNLIYKESK